ncbi:MAG: hypothetical protein ACTSQQ_02800, partial [Candidatus Helarchaeota archaeon]
LMSQKVFPVLAELSQTQYIIKLSDLVTACIKRHMKVVSCDVSGNFWIDLDTPEDIELFLQIYMQNEEKISGGEIY